MEKKIISLEKLLQTPVCYMSGVVADSCLLHEW